MKENGNPLLLGQGIKRVKPAVVRIEMVIRRIELYSFSAQLYIFLQFLLRVGNKGRIDGAEGEIDLLSFTKLENVLIRDHACGDGAHIRKYDGLDDVVFFEVSGESLWIGQFFIAFVKLRF